MSTSASLPRSTSGYSPARDTGQQQPLFENVPASDISWKAELNARLREHRQRRGEQSAVVASSVLEPPSGRRRGSRADGAATSAVAARVAERYREAPSYQELLAASAAAAESAAEAALEAHAAAQAALAEWGSAEQPVAATDPCGDAFFTQPQSRPVIEEQPAYTEAAFGEETRQPFQASPVVEHHAPLPERTAVPARPLTGQRPRTLVDAFAEAVVPAAQSLPAKLIEFPRELIAPRKQRPRLAEGPLAEDHAEDLPPEQEAPATALRIFEVTAVDAAPQERHADGRGPSEYRPDQQNQIPDRMSGGYGVSDNNQESMPSRRRRTGFSFGEDSSGPGSAPEATGWGSIRLGEHPQNEPEIEVSSERPAIAALRPGKGYQQEASPALHDLAPISSRVMAALVDGGLVFGSFLASVLVFASCTVHMPAGKSALVVAGLALGVLATFYGWLFMSFGGGSTPGMRYARIALCTFSDENPTRKDLQGRIPATALALLPLGLGVFWAILDEDKLGWHDRMTRTYQRLYK